MINSAIKVCQNAYANYSEYRVGAALLAEDGSIYTGCNIENSSYSLTCCAERVALFKAVSEGKRNFSAIAIAAVGENGENRQYCVPCGACRQVMSEFCDGDFQVICIKSKDDYKTYKLTELIPHNFSAETMEN